MIRLVITVLLLLYPVSVWAQDAARPIVRTDLGSASAVPGQPVVLRLTVLVPTWLPQPPVLPSFDLPNLMVRLPGRSTFPVSERVNGESWSGISREYRLYPMVAEPLSIPPQQLIVHYADPDTRKPVEVEIQTEAVLITGVIPKGAEDLKPFIAAKDLKLEQTVDGKLTDLEPGGAVTQRVRLTIKGASPMVVPLMLRAEPVLGLSVYGLEPVQEETLDRDVLSGSRIEQMTYVAEAGGRFTIPAVRLRWFNLRKGEIETAETENFQFAVRGPPPRPVKRWDWREAALRWAPFLFVFALFVVVIWRLWSHIDAWRQKRRAEYLSSENYAFEEAVRAVKDHHLAKATIATDRWWAQHTHGLRRVPASVTAAFERIGVMLYGREQVDCRQSALRWSEAIKTLYRVEKVERSASRHLRDSALQPLNPPVAGAQMHTGD